MKKKKDILFLCQFFYPEYVSSATLPFDTAVALKKSGYSVDVFCGYPQEYFNGQEAPSHETVEGIEIHRVKYLKMDKTSFVGRLINYFSFTFMMFLRLFQFANYRAVIVYTNPPILPWVASWGKILFGTKLILVAYDLYPEIAVRTNTLRDGNIICRLMHHINKCVYRRANCVVALSNEMKSYIIENRPIAPDKVKVIPNWYADNKTAESEQTDNKFAETVGNRFVVSYFGNMGTAQDMETILGAIRMLKDSDDICFLFAGHGNKMASIKQVITDEKISNVFMFEFLHGKDYQDALQISGCALVSLENGLTGLCVPSKTYSYMMQGIPLLAIMDEGDIVSDIESGAGCWVRNGDVSALVEKICFMQSHVKELSDMRKKCRSIYLEKYTTEVCTNKYVDMFRELI